MSDVDKRAFWAYFFQALAGAEAVSRSHHSGTSQAASGGEDRSGHGHDRTRSEGLLQLSYQDEKRYGCDFDWEKDKSLKPNDPEQNDTSARNNLECGIKILREPDHRSAQAAADQEKLLGAAAAGDLFASRIF